MLEFDYELTIPIVVKVKEDLDEPEIINAYWQPISGQPFIPLPQYLFDYLAKFDREDILALAKDHLP